ncbi:MAG: type II toxin-antitoxin system HicA family toxin [Gemmatimonadota bacterium]
MTDYSKLATLTARQILSALHADGFTLVRQKGSHRHFKHSDGRRVTVSFHHSADTFRRGTLRSMIDLQARWTEEDLRRLELLR